MKTTAKERSEGEKKSVRIFTTKKQIKMKFITPGP